MADISYTPTTWADGAEGGTPIDAAKLNNIESGIVDAVAAIGPNDTTADGTLKAQIDTNSTAISAIKTAFFTQTITTDATGRIRVTKPISNIVNVFAESTQYYCIIRYLDAESVLVYIRHIDTDAPAANITLPIICRYIP